jgi:hypothetical protein
MLLFCCHFLFVLENFELWVIMHVRPHLDVVVHVVVHAWMELFHHRLLQCSSGSRRPTCCTSRSFCCPCRPEHTMTSILSSSSCAGPGFLLTEPPWLRRLASGVSACTLLRFHAISLFASSERAPPPHFPEKKDRHFAFSDSLRRHPATQTTEERVAVFKHSMV